MEEVPTLGKARASYRKYVQELHALDVRVCVFRRYTCGRTLFVGEQVLNVITR